MVSTSLFKGAFTDSAMHLFSFIVSLFVHYVGNVALIRRRVSGLFVQLQLFFDYFFISLITDLIFALNYFYIIPVEYFTVFLVVGKMILNYLKEVFTDAVSDVL